MPDILTLMRSNVSTSRARACAGTVASMWGFFISLSTTARSLPAMSVVSSSSVGAVPPSDETRVVAEPELLHGVEGPRRRCR